MNLLVPTYLIYLALSVGFTVWVGYTLSSNGLVFLDDVFNGDRGVARSVNHLLVVGFYLLNFGFIALFVRTSQDVTTARQLFDVLSVKLGTTLLVLGVMHLINLRIFTRMRRTRTRAGAPAR